MDTWVWYAESHRTLGAGEVSQCLRVLAVFAEDLVWFPAPTWWFTTGSNSSSRGRKCSPPASVGIACTDIQAIQISWSRRKQDSSLIITSHHQHSGPVWQPQEAQHDLLHSLKISFFTWTSILSSSPALCSSCPCHLCSHQRPKVAFLVHSLLILSVHEMFLYITWISIILTSSQPQTRSIFLIPMKACTSRGWLWDGTSWWLDLRIHFFCNSCSAIHWASKVSKHSGPQRWPLQLPASLSISPLDSFASSAQCQHALSEAQISCPCWKPLWFLGWRRTVFS